MLKDQKGLSHVVLPLILVIVVAVVGIFSYNRIKDSNKSNKDTDPSQMTATLDAWKTQCQGSGPVMMQHTPMDVADISIIHPTGLLAAAHVTPIDHLYFYAKGDAANKRDANPVYAMADGFIVADDLAERGQTLNNGKLDNGAIKIVVQHNCTLYSYYDLMTSLDPGIAAKLKAGDKHIAIKAGQVIGRVGGQSLDAAIYNLDLILPGFINPKTYGGEPWKIHTDDFFAYFSGKNLSDMLALNPRKIEPYGGKIDYDIAGKLRGNWFEVGTNGYAGPVGSDRNSTSENAGYASGHLAIVPDAVTPSTINLSFGNYEGKALQFNALSQAPDPATVDANSGIVKYELTTYRQPTLLPSGQDGVVQGTVLYQLTNNGKNLKMETFPGKRASQVSAFTSAVKTYER